MNILNRLTIKHLTMNKKRTIVTVIGIILSTALMVAIGLLFSSIKEYSLKEVINSNGRYHSYIAEVDTSKLEIIAKNQKIEKFFYRQVLGLTIKDDKNPAIAVAQVDKNYFTELKLESGRIPTNSKEIIISRHLMNNGNSFYDLGDKVSLTYGKLELDEKGLSTGQLINPITKEYTIVGIVSDSPYEGLADFALTTFDEVFNGQVGVFLIYYNTKDVYSETKDLCIALDLEKGNNGSYNIETNTSLLALYGNSGYDNFDRMIISQMSIILGLIAVGCLIVIYNSFAISVMERKKQFGLFASIGATRRQIRKTVFFEAIVVGVIGIILGIGTAFLGIGIVLLIINSLMKEVLVYGLDLVAYPLYIILPIIFMIVVVLVSAYLPARSASRVSPITAIRQNDDIKIKGKKLRTNRLIKKIFGIEGELALKNIKRNKKKYRITIISLFISIVLFIVFSAYLLYGTSGTEQYLGTYSFDAFVMVNNGNIEQINKKTKLMKNLNTVSDYVELRMITIPIKNIELSLLTDKYKEVNKNDLPHDDLVVVSLDDSTYHKYLKQLNLNEEQPVFLNTYKTVRYESSGRKSYELSILNSNKIDFTVCDLRDIYGTTYPSFEVKKECTYKLDNIYVTKEIRFGLDVLEEKKNVLIVNAETFKYLYDNFEYDQHAEIKNRKIEEASYMSLFKAEDTKRLDELGEEFNNLEGVQYLNVTKAMQLQKNIILVMKILLYGFISLVTLIGVTSVFNTINTSIALRRKEFAVLRSVGLTPLGFNKILYMESLFFGLKSLLYALPFSIIIVYLIYRSMGDLVYSDTFILPWNSIIIAIISVFLIVLITMLYSAKRIKKENILDAIREENI